MRHAALKATSVRILPTATSSNLNHEIGRIFTSSRREIKIWQNDPLPCGGTHDGIWTDKSRWVCFGTAFLAFGGYNWSPFSPRGLQRGRLPVPTLSNCTIPGLAGNGRSDV